MLRGERPGTRRLRAEPIARSGPTKTRRPALEVQVQLARRGPHSDKRAVAHTTALTQAHRGTEEAPRATDHGKTTQLPRSWQAHRGTEEDVQAQIMARQRNCQAPSTARTSSTSSRTKHDFLCMNKEQSEKLKTVKTPARSRERSRCIYQRVLIRVSQC